MSNPIVFISRQKIKPGKLDGYKQNFQDVLNFIEPNKPNTVGFFNYCNEDNTEATLIQVYPNAEAMEQHVQGLTDIAKKSYEFMDIASFEIYGKPSEATLTAMAKLAQTGVPVKIAPHYNGGILRLKAK